MTTEELLKKQDILIKKYPLLFADGELRCEFSCGPGWYDIIDKLCEDITTIITEHPELEDEDRFVKVVQIKEKFSSLRFYVEAVHESIYDKVYELIKKTESQSSKICEECGKPGILRRGGWLKTRCDSCQSEYSNSRYSDYTKTL